MIIGNSYSSAVSLSVYLTVIIGVCYSTSPTQYCFSSFLKWNIKIALNPKLFTVKNFCPRSSSILNYAINLALLLCASSDTCLIYFKRPSVLFSSPWLFYQKMYINQYFKGKWKIYLWIYMRSPSLGGYWCSNPSVPSDLSISPFFYIFLWDPLT